MDDGNHDGNDGVGNNVGYLSEIEVEVLSGIHKEPHLSAKKIANQIGVTDRTVERAIHTLKDSGFIKREGSNRGK